jgi:hypothetical protein
MNSTSRRRTSYVGLFWAFWLFLAFSAFGLEVIDDLKEGHLTKVYSTFCS